jgi:hypothetical protein
VNLLYIILQDIDSVSSIKSVPAGGESPKVDKPLSPPTENSMPEPSKLLSPESAQGRTGAEGTPTSTSCANSSHDAANIPPRPEPAEIPEASPPSPQSYVLGASGGP